MPQIVQLYNEMRKKKHNIPSEILVELGFDRKGLSANKFSKREFEILTKMNDLLTDEQKCEIMQTQGCHKSPNGKYSIESKSLAEKYANLTLEEQVALVSRWGDMHINEMGNIVLVQGCDVGDAEGIVKSCHCIRANYKENFDEFAREYPDKVLSLMQLYCGCCAGHIMYHLQIRLGVKLRLIKIGTAPKTEKGCLREHTFEILS